ncbi:MAG TPA: hypothetical protein VFH39_04755 [Candidatus Saccharimonadales bacterium]|nr:hypothetical protein [Candidatus Saccharimonadales bacterium]
MTGLQTAFYIVALVFMGINLLLIIALLSAVLVIKAKVNKLHDAVDEKVSQVKDIGAKAGLVFRTVKHFAKR